jgi:hypothetical protein
VYNIQNEGDICNHDELDFLQWRFKQNSHSDQKIYCTVYPPKKSNHLRMIILQWPSCLHGNHLQHQQDAIQRHKDSRQSANEDLQFPPANE